ncbi:MAG: PAS domain-containing sensor histidine kinase [Candidatus Methylacidiphilales bacterium]
MTSLLLFAMFLLLVQEEWRAGNQVAAWFDERLGYALFVTFIVISFIALMWSRVPWINRIETKRSLARDLDRENERLRMVLKGAGITTWRWDAKTGAIIWPDENEDLPDVSRERPATISDFLAVVHPDHRDELIKQFNCSITDKTEYSYKYRIVLPDGQAVWRSVQGRISCDPAGNPLSAEGILMDVHAGTVAEQALQLAHDGMERKVAERTEELRLAKEKAETADRHKSRFIASMSHELRTPLNAILGFTGTLLMGLPGPLTPEQRRQLETVRSSARHQLALINDLLDVARIESGGVQVNLEIVNCNSLVEGVAATLRPLADVKHLELTVDVPSEPIVMRTDQRKVSQIIINLANNAIKFTEKGSVRISLSATPRGMDLAVHDTGVGMKAEHLDKLFQPFSRIENGLTTRIEGSGLGLHLSQMLAGLLGGRIEVTSVVGNGSCFRLLLEKESLGN